MLFNKTPLCRLGFTVSSSPSSDPSGDPSGSSLRHNQRHSPLKLLLLATCVLLNVVVVSDTHGASKKKPAKPVGIEADKVFAVTISYTNHKGATSQEIKCYQNVAGQTKTRKKKISFTSLKTQLKDLKRKFKKPKAKQKRQIADLKALIKASDGVCTEEEHLSLIEYRGPFTEDQARTLYDRFGLGASPEQISAAVAKGLDKTVDSLLTAVGEPEFDTTEQELRCDGYLGDDTRNENGDTAKCPPNNKNAIRFSGVRYDIYERLWRSRNQFFQKLFLFLHDERMAAGSSVLSGCDRYALVDHVHLLRDVAFSGDYRQFMRSWNNDYLGHLVWLDGASNSGEKPNENYAREFWELGTVGPISLDGKPVYNDLDIAQSALAFSGWTKEYDNFTDGTGKEYGVCYAARAPLKHATGMKRVFGGTPYEAMVDNDEDMLRATFNHPRTAEHLAEDLWREFINPYATPITIQKLAVVIRDNDYKLLPVLRKMMKSRALYAAKSQKSLIKHPLELVFGFLRQTGIPIIDQKYEDSQTKQMKTGASKYEVLEYNLIDDIGQVPTQPPTVFGWNEKKLAAELYVIPWRNGLTRLLNQDREDLRDMAGFTFKARFFGGLPPAGTAAEALVDRLAKMLSISLTQAQKDHLVTYLNNEYRKCYGNEKNDPTLGCDGSGNRLKRDTFDPHPDADDRFETRLRGALLILASLPQYRMK